MDKRLSLQDLATILAEATGRGREETERFLHELVALLTEQVAAGDAVRVKGLGTFKSVRVEPRESVNVNTGERFVIASHYKFSFLADKELRELVNRPFSLFETVELSAGVAFDDLGEGEPEEKPADPADESAEEILPEPATAPADSVAPGVPRIHSVAYSTPPSAPVPPAWRPAGWLRRLGVLFLALGVAVGAYYGGKQACMAEREAAATDPAPLLLPDSVPTAAAEDTTAAEKDTLPPAPPADVQPEAIDTIVIRPGDRLTTYALRYYGHKIFWVYIYDYNAADIADPNNIPIGTTLRLPPAARYGIDAQSEASRRAAALKQTEILARF